MRRTALVAIPVVLTIGLAGCGLANPGGQSTTPQPSPETQTSGPPSSPEPSPGDNSQPPQEPGPGTPEVTVKVDGQDQKLNQDDVECNVGSAGMIAFTNADPHGAESGIVMTLKTDPPTAHSFVYTSDDYALGPLFNEQTEVLTVSPSGESWVVTGTIENGFDPGTDVEVEVVASCTT